MTMFLAAVASTGMSILGVTLGKPLNVPECEFRTQHKFEKKREDKPQYVVHPPSTCFKKAKNPGTFHIKFPIGDKIPIVSRNTISVQLLDGKVEYISLFTEGRFWQKRDLDILVNKFGEPQSQETVLLQNGFGATANAIKARWTFDGGYLQRSVEAYRSLANYLSPKAPQLRRD